MMLGPEQQRELGDLMNHDPAGSERVWRKWAKDMATDQFSVINPPQTFQEIAEIHPMMIGFCAQQASVPVSPGRVQQLQHAARAAYYERLCNLTDAAAITKGDVVA